MQGSWKGKSSQTHSHMNGIFVDLATPLWYTPWCDLESESRDLYNLQVWMVITTANSVLVAGKLYNKLYVSGFYYVFNAETNHVEHVCYKFRTYTALCTLI